jgi:hypothetical protein
VTEHTPAYVAGHPVAGDLIYSTVGIDGHRRGKFTLEM